MKDHQGSKIETPGRVCYLEETKGLMLRIPVVPSNSCLGHKIDSKTMITLLGRENMMLLLFTTIFIAVIHSMVLNTVRYFSGGFLVTI
ncbi:CLUMA_CG015501, isoform A [Clunio marinus]|uniref:CLUMA_CG015501, isoform A n=1 Tax=Clunio marinus TaxID=568069 RepID=A0A1J1IV60_9DIPT|nr:CLUMA_CG015501, isoform A [Clunio marinus]